MGSFDGVCAHTRTHTRRVGAGIHQQRRWNTRVSAEGEHLFGSASLTGSSQKPNMISCVSAEAGATIQSFVPRHNASRLPSVNRLAGSSSSAATRQTKYFAASVTVLASARALLFLFLRSEPPPNERFCSGFAGSVPGRARRFMFDIIGGDGWGVEGV